MSMKKISVKAREHYGSKSLDLTIPVELKEKYDIKAGDVFEIEVVERGRELVAIAYRKMKAV